MPLKNPLLWLERELLRHHAATDLDLRGLAVELRQQQYSQVPSLFPDSIVQGLSDEVLSLARTGTLAESDFPLYHTLNGKGPLLGALHGSGPMLSFVRAVSGRIVVPTSWGYQWYREGDHVGLHIDEPDCDVNVLAVATGSVGPFHLHPDREFVIAAGEPRYDDADPHPPGGVPIAYPYHGAVVLRGREVLHDRPPRRDSEPGAVLFLCYRALF